MKTLAIECSTHLGSVAVCDESGVLTSSSWRRQRSHGELLTSNVETCLLQAELSLKDLNFICVGNGPGSFTGIRVSLSAAKAFAYSENLPLVIKDSLQILAAKAPLSFKNLLAVQNAFSEKVFISQFEAGKSKWIQKSRPVLIENNEFPKYMTRKTLVLGEGLETLPKEVIKKIRPRLISCTSLDGFPHAADLARISFTDFKRGRTLNWKECEALYVRASAAEEKMKKGLLKPMI